MNEIVGVMIANPPVVSVFTITDDVEDAQVQAFIEELDGRDLYAYVVHRGKKTPSQALAKYLGEL